MSGHLLFHLWWDWISWDEHCDHGLYESLALQANIFQDIDA